MRRGACRGLLIALLGLGANPAAAAMVLDAKAALEVGQAAIGRQLGDHAFRDTELRAVRLSDFRGRPMIINLVYTGCSSVCPLVVQNLTRAVEVAQDALGQDSFRIATIGFDVRHDTPERMRAFAHAQGVALANWRFLSADAESIRRLASEVGFVAYPAPQGFDHLALTTIVDANGRIYRQVYGGAFETPAVVEPLKELVFGARADWTSLDGVISRVRLFCTLYDPRTDRYRFDYSPFVGMAIGLLALSGIAGFAFREWRRGRRVLPEA
jgi:protein SCO1/2